MTHHHAAVKEAIYAYAHKDTYDAQAKLDAAVSLAEWGLFSNRQIAKLVGTHPANVASWTTKRDRTGGTLKPEALPDVLKVIEIHARGEVDHAAVKKALEGVSSTMLARLTGRAQTTLSYQARRAVAAEEAKNAA